jgi:hypothetical protein
MLQAAAHLLLHIGGIVAGWFWDTQAPNFAVIQMATAVLIFTLFVIFLAYWPFFWWVKLIRRKKARTTVAKTTEDKPLYRDPSTYR